MTSFASILLFLLLIRRALFQVETLSDLDSMYAELLDAHFDKQTLIPTINISHAISVNVEFNLSAIRDVNVNAGQVGFSGFLTLTWTDERYPAISNHRIADIYVMVPASSLWTPTLTLVNGVSSAADISASASSIKFNFKTFGMSWKTYIYQTASCKMDNLYYPFDSHQCTFRYTSLGYGADRLVLAVGASGLDTSQLSENPEWTLTEASSATSTDGSASYFQFTLKLTRKSSYTALKIFLPTILVALVSSFCLLIPLQTSDRTLFSGICLLAMLGLYLYNLALIPSSSTSIPLIMYFLFLEIIFSAIVSLLAIVSIKIGSRPTHKNVPGWLISVVSCLRCSCSINNTERSRKVKRTAIVSLTDISDNGHRHDIHTNADGKVQPVTSESAWDDEVLDKDDSGSTSDRNPESNGSTGQALTWREVGKTLDYVFMVGIFILQICICCGFLIPLILNSLR